MVNREMRLKTDEPQGPQIMLNYLRNPKTGKADRIRTAPLKAGMRIERMGKIYEVDAHGTQRRVK
jgi:hypothetical protein